MVKKLHKHSANRHILHFPCIVMLLLLSAAAIPTEVTAEPQSEQLTVRDGHILLTAVSSSSVIPLSGEWKFIPQRLARTFSNVKTSELITVPSDWNDRVLSENGWELGTYGVTIEGLIPGERYSLHLGEIGAAARVFANGVFIGQTAALTPDESGPDISFAKPIYSFEATEGSNHIAIQVANGDLAVGGIWQRIFFGTTPAVYRHRLIRTALGMFFTGGIFILGMYYLFVYVLWREQHSSLMLALYSFLVALKSVFSGQQIIFTALPAFPDLFGIRLAHLATVISVPVFVQFIRYLYPGITGKLGITLSCSLALLQSILIIFFPPSVFQQTAFWYHGVIVLHVPYIFWVFFTARRRGRSGIPIGVIGFIILILAGANDILHDQRVIHTTYLWNVGFFFFLFAQASLQAHRFRIINEESEKIKLNLKQAVAKRTVELTRERNKLSHMAKTDELTGLHNRRYGMEQLHNELNRVRRYGGSVVIALLDVDHFKYINDNHGHLVGDRVLITIGSLLKEGIRSVDFSSRWGGEEFLLFFPNTALEDGRIAMEKIRQSIYEYHFRSKSGPFSVTFSYGLYTFTGGQEGVEEVLQHCDIALYHAKNTGRNRGVNYSNDLRKVSPHDRLLDSESAEDPRSQAAPQDN
jgi:diguanylate cyclase (GGDEF)-like protein